MPSTTQWSQPKRQWPPPNWAAIRRRVLARDRTCRLQYVGCTVVSTDADHVGERDDHRLSMLRGVCHECHVKRTQEQARAAIRRAARNPETHPGVIP